MTSELIEVQIGKLPWEPSDDAEPVATYHRYDMPLIGVVRQKGIEFLFRCIAGHASTTSFWTYSRLTPEQRAAIEAAEGREAADSAVQAAALFPVLLAVSVEGSGLVASTRVAAAADVPDASQRLLAAFDGWRQSLDLPSDIAVEIQHALAS